MATTPRWKSDQPLLLYVTCIMAPNYAIWDLEEDKIDPAIVVELLKRKCAPNQSFVSFTAYSLRDQGTRTVREAILFYMHKSSCLTWPHTTDDESSSYDLDQHQQAAYDFRLRWVKTVKLFLEYGADPIQFVVGYGYTWGWRWKTRYPKSRISGLLISNRALPILTIHWCHQYAVL